MTKLDILKNSTKPPKKILITGANGFLGSNLHKFISKKNKSFKIFISRGDLRKYTVALRNTKDIDFVFHMACDMGGVGYFSEQNYYPPMNNFLIDLNVLRACEENKVKRLFYPASACAYPFYMMEKGLPLKEEMLNLPADPDQMYGWEKLTLIKLLRNSPIDCRVGILHTIYGEGQEYQGKKAKFPPQIAYKTLESIQTNEIEVWGDGKQTRTFLFVDDALNKIYEVMMNPKYWGEVNIGSDKETSINSIVNLCNKILKIKPNIRYDLSKPVGPHRRSCDNKKYNMHYKAREKITLEEGFRRVISQLAKDKKIIIK